MQTLLRVKQWIVPNYALPPDAQNQDILRVVVRETVSAELIHKLVQDIVEATESLMSEFNFAFGCETAANKPGRRNRERHRGHAVGDRVGKRQRTSERSSRILKTVLNISLCATS